MRVVNFFAGPGCGKSTLAAGLFSRLKLRGKNCELVTEYAKDLTWRESHKVLEDQLLVFAEQHHRLLCLEDKIDLAITDSPLLLSSIYGGFPNPKIKKTFDSLVRGIFDDYLNFNIVLTRTKPYVKIGRSQTHEEACKIDDSVNRFLWTNGVPSKQVTGDENGLDAIEQMICNWLELTDDEARKLHYDEARNILYSAGRISGPY